MNILPRKYIAVVAGLASLLSSCSKKIEDRTDQYPALQPASLDISATGWKPILATSLSSFTVAAPDAVTSAAYLADLNEIKGYQRNLTGSQRELISYWSAGAVLRWNQILRTLVARHNLPPYQLENGTYPAPSSANPFSYPQFPFSNPPYAARSFAYVSGAQYDALLAAWYYKNQYNRKAPYLNDTTIKALIPKSSLPSYPSEDAVVEGAAVEVLKMMFPTEIAYLEQQAADERSYRMMAGVNTRGELDAGESLGRQVADLFTARARADRAGKAIGTPAYWQQLATSATVRGEIPWISLESPKRPPMLPLYNKTLPFLFDTLTVAALRPAPPYSTHSAAFLKETAEVLYYSKHATRDRERIVSFWADGAGTSTPIGHWNSIACDEFVRQNWTEVRWARNLAIMNMAEMDAAICCWDAKYFYFNPRPSQMDPTIKTLTGVPNFPSYTSGHSNLSGAASTFLTYLLPDRGTKFTDMAKEATMSRLYGAIHYRSDCEMGLVVGIKVGGYAVARAQSDGADQ